MTSRADTSPLSLKLSPATHSWLDHLRRWTGDTKSGLARRYVEEGLRMELHPGVVFRDGPGGRRAALLIGPDVWQVVAAAKLLASKSLSDSLDRTARWLALSPGQVRTAIDYYKAFRAEIEELLEANAAAANHAAAVEERERAEL